MVFLGRSKFGSIIDDLKNTFVICNSVNLSYPVLESRYFVSSSSPSRFGISYDRQFLVDVQTHRSVQDEKGQPPVWHRVFFQRVF